MVTDPVTFSVEGLPAPQGSKRHVGGGRMVESSKKVGPWRADVELAARRAMIGTFTGPVAVTITFLMPMPKSRPARVRAAGTAWSSVRPDIDKLARSTLDALTASTIISDDARVARLRVEKIECSTTSGATITIQELEPLK